MNDRLKSMAIIGLLCAALLGVLFLIYSTASSGGSRVLMGVLLVAAFVLIFLIGKVRKGGRR